jgi:alpha-L-rhamnosidase
MLLQLEVEYTDGTSERIVSDESWKLSTKGPIIANNEFDGEVYDARREMPGWAAPGFDDKGWLSAKLVAAPGGKLRCEPMNPIRVTGNIQPVSITEPVQGTFIYDFGQNFVGWYRLKVKGEAGMEVKLRFAERLKPDGQLDTANLRKALVTDFYTLKGADLEIYEPRFTYHGFRYVEVTGFPGKPTLEALEGLIVNDDVATASEFTCSNPTINRIYQNAVWGVRETTGACRLDCPQRDERQGWLGDRSVGCRGEMFLFDVAALYAKWLTDFADGQSPTGSVSDVNPPYWALYNDSVTWPSSTVFIPMQLLEMYAEKGLIARHYPSMAKWTDYMAGFIKDGLISKRQLRGLARASGKARDDPFQRPRPQDLTNDPCDNLFLPMPPVYDALRHAFGKAGGRRALPSPCGATQDGPEPEFLQQGKGILRQWFADLVHFAAGLRHGAGRRARTRVRTYWFPKSKASPRDMWAPD